MKNMELTDSPYPSGHYNDDVLELLQKIGISMAVTVKSGSVKRGDSLLELKKYGICSMTTIDKFKNMVNNNDST